MNPSLKSAGDVADGRDDLHAGRLELLHLRVEVGEREADVIDGRARARLRRVVLEEDEPRLPERHAVLAFGGQLPAEVLAVPLDRCRLIRRGEVDVIVGQRGLCAGRARPPAAMTK